MLNAASQSKSTDGSLTPASAVRTAWITWLTLGAIPLVLFIYVVWRLLDTENTSRNDGHTWFIAAMAYLLVTVPASFFWRSKLHRSYYSGTPVRPDKYLVGMISVWVALVIGGLFSLTGCLVYKTMLPDLIPALVAFMFFVTLYPSGRAMTRHVGNSEDASVYEEPR